MLYKLFLGGVWAVYWWCMSGGLVVYRWGMGGVHGIYW